MWNKIYVAVLAVSVAIMAFFTYYSWSWLQSRGNPADAAEGYAYNAMIAWTVLWLTSLVLLLPANAVLWVSRRSWAMWVTFSYFSAFIVVRYFWLEQALFQFRKINGLTNQSFSAGPIFGVILVFLAGVIVFFVQYLVLRLRVKSHPEPAVVINTESTE